MTPQHHASIIGGGVIGLSLAWELARRGLRVTLLERDRIGQATSWAGGGILPAANLSKATDPLDQLRGLSHSLFPEWTKELKAATGVDSEFRRCGGWYLADTRGEQASLVGMTDYWSELGIECDAVSLQSLARREPALSAWAQQTSPASAWWVPGECQIRPPRYLRALRHACHRQGVELIENVAVTDVRGNGDRAEVIAGDRRYESDSVVICSGVWSGQVAKSLQLDMSLIPIRGQMLLLKADRQLLAGIVNVGHRYVICRGDGHTLVGSCEEEVGFELGTTESVLKSLREFAVSLVPALSSAEPVDSWSGLRPMTFDGFPMIGRAPGLANVYVATGHFRSGLHLSTGTAVTLADLITGNQPVIDLEPFRVGKQQSDASMRIAVMPE